MGKSLLFRIIAMSLSIIIFFNVFIIGIAGSNKVEAGIIDSLENNKDGIIMVVKGLIMFWIINLMTKNNPGDNNESFLTSTIKNSLNIAEEENSEIVDKKTNSIQTESVEKSDITIIDNREENEKDMLNLINKARKEKGLKDLVFDNKLVKIARMKASDIISNDYFAHESPKYGTPFEMLENEGIKYGLAGENLAQAGNINDAFTQLMNSPAHRENILDKRYDKVGIGVKQGGSYGLTIVQLFIDLPDPAI